MKALSRAALRFRFFRVRQVGQIADRFAGVEDGAGPDIGGPAFQLGPAGVESASVEDVGPLVQFGCRGVEAAGANVVAADGEHVEVVKIDTVEYGQSSGEADGVGEAAGES